MYAAVVLEWLLPAPPADPASAYHAYGLLLSLLASADPATAVMFHDSDPKRLAVGPLRRVPWNRLPAADEEAPPAHRYWHRVAFLGGDAVARALAALGSVTPHWSGKLGHLSATLAGVHLSPARHPSVAVATREDLAAPAPEGPRVELRFLTPTGFRLGSGHQGLLPDPGLLFTSLLTRWNGLHPTDPFDLPRPAIERQVRVEALRLTSRALDFGNYQQLGCVGTMRLAWPDAPPETAATLLALARFATFSGVGAKTAMGMGGVSIDERPLSRRTRRGASAPRAPAGDPDPHR